MHIALGSNERTGPWELESMQPPLLPWCVTRTDIHKVTTHPPHTRALCPVRLVRKMIMHVEDACTRIHGGVNGLRILKPAKVHRSEELQPGRIIWILGCTPEGSPTSNTQPWSMVVVRESVTMWGITINLRSHVQLKCDVQEKLGSNLRPSTLPPLTLDIKDTQSRTTWPL